MKTIVLKTLIRVLPLMSAVLIIACGGKEKMPVVPGDPQGPVCDTLVILSTNDVHAQIANMPREAAYIKSVKNRYANVLVVSSGDIFSGNPAVDQYDERGYPIIDLMNRMGYRIMCLGNHDFDYGQEVLARRIDQAAFPVICANADFSSTELDGRVAAFDTIRVGNLKVSLLGVLQTGGSQPIPSTHPNNVAGITFTRATNPSFWTQWSWLRAWGDVFIVLSHLGAEDDTALAPLLAVKPDVIIGGHSHTALNPGAATVGGVLITQAGSNLNNIGRTVVTLKDGKITSRKNTLIALSGLTAEDGGIKSLVQTYQNNPKFQEVIGQASSAFSGKEAVANLMTDALARQLECDIAFTNSGGVRTNRLPAGNITLGKVYEIDPFENLSMVYDMSLDEIRALLAYSCYYVTAAEPNNFNLYISGARFYYDIAAKSVRLTDYNGAPLPSKTYKVAMSSYVAETYMSRITHADQGTLYNKTTAACLADFIRAEGTVSPQGKRAFSE